MFAIVSISSRVCSIYVRGEIRVHRFRSLEIILITIITTIILLVKFLRHRCCYAAVGSSLMKELK